MALFILSVFVALSVSFTCSVVEAALLSLTPGQIADISLRRPRFGIVWQRFKANIEYPISVILIINTVAHTMGAAVAGSQFNKLFGDKWIWIFSVVFTFLMLQYTEILPKTIGVRFNRYLAIFIARPLNAAISVLRPVIHFTQWVNRPFTITSAKTGPIATVEEIAAMAGLARLSNQIGSHQERIIKGASRLSRLPVRQVMIPVEQISFLSSSKTLAEAVLAAHIDAHTRFPVCEGDDRNKVIGYVNFKEMIYFMRTNPNATSFRGIVRPVHLALPDDSAADLIKAFVDQHVHMAIVRDRAGKTLGLVTLEDLVEELVGELEDEFDRLPRMFHILSSGVWMVGGGMPMVEVCQRLELTIPVSQETLSRWLSRRLGRLARPGDTYQDAGAEFNVRRVRRGKIFEVSITKSRPSTPIAGL
jgi:CBS domain containing-hemolysin-like protein